MTVSSWLNFGRPAPWGSGVRRGENFWLRLTTASAQCLRLLWALFSSTLCRAISDKSRSRNNKKIMQEVRSTCCSMKFLQRYRRACRKLKRINRVMRNVIQPLAVRMLQQGRSVKYIDDGGGGWSELRMLNGRTEREPEGQLKRSRSADRTIDLCPRHRLHHSVARRALLGANKILSAAATIRLHLRWLN